MKHIGCSLLALWLLFSAAVPAVRAGEPEEKAFCLMEASTGTVLDARNEHEPLPPASVTKIMTLLLIMEAVDSGRIGLDDPVTASETAAAKGGSQIYLKAGETLSVREMVKSIAVASANDCACAMAELLAGTEAAFTEQMNEKAAALGMADTHFVNCTGLDDSPEAEAHRTSAYDLALMSRALLTEHPDIRDFTTIWMDSVRGGAFGLTNTNKLVRFYPGCTGLKTGFTAAAGYCLSASAEHDGMTLIAVVLGGKTSGGRFSRCRELLDAGFAQWTLYTPTLPQCRIPVRMGVQTEVQAVPNAPVRLLVEKARLSALSAEALPVPLLRAPVAQGAPAGTLHIRENGRVLASFPLTAASAVGRLHFGALFSSLFSRVAMAGEVFANSQSLKH